MGQCYSVYLKVRYKDEERFRVLSALAIRSAGVAEHSLEGFDFLKTEEHVRYVLAAMQDGFSAVCGDGWLCYSSDFDASYSWEEVLYTWFRGVAPALGDGSSIKVLPDEGEWYCVVKSGVAEDELPPF